MVSTKLIATQEYAIVNHRPREPLLSLLPTTHHHPDVYSYYSANMNGKTQGTWDFFLVDQDHDVNIFNPSHFPYTKTHQNPGGIEAVSFSSLFIVGGHLSLNHLKGSLNITITKRSQTGRIARKVAFRIVGLSIPHPPKSPSRLKPHPTASAYFIKLS